MMDLSPTDILGALSTARKIDPNPVGLAGRIIGLSEDEIKAGVPAWTWAALAFGAGVLATVALGPKVKMVANSMPWISGSGAKPNKKKQAFGRWTK